MELTDRGELTARQHTVRDLACSFVLGSDMIAHATGPEWVTSRPQQAICGGSSARRNILAFFIIAALMYLGPQLTTQMWE